MVESGDGQGALGGSQKFGGRLEKNAKLKCIIMLKPFVLNHTIKKMLYLFAPAMELKLLKLVCSSRVKNKQV